MDMPSLEQFLARAILASPEFRKLVRGSMSSGEIADKIAKEIMGSDSMMQFLKTVRDYIEKRGTHE